MCSSWRYRTTTPHEQNTLCNKEERVCFLTRSSLLPSGERVLSFSPFTFQSEATATCEATCTSWKLYDILTGRGSHNLHERLKSHAEEKHEARSTVGEMP